MANPEIRPPAPSVEDTVTLKNYKFRPEGENRSNAQILSVVRTKADRTAFTTWETIKSIFGIYDQATTVQRIIPIERSKIGCWNRFIGFFGFGDLAHAEIKLVKLKQFLLKFDWHGSASTNIEAYTTVCTVAQRLLVYKRQLGLWEHVSPMASDIGSGRLIRTNPVIRGIDALHQYIIQNPYDPCNKSYFHIPLIGSLHHHGTMKRVSIEDLKLYRKEPDGQINTQQMPVDLKQPLERSRPFHELYAIRNEGFRIEHE